MSRLDRNIEITCNFETINIPPSAPLKYLVHPILQDNIDGVHWGLFYGALDRSQNKTRPNVYRCDSVQMVED